MATLSVSKEKEPLFLVLENTNWLSFQMLKPSQSKRPKSKFSLLNAELGLNPTQFYYKIERTRQIEDDTYIFHQTYIPEQYINPNYPNLEYYSSIYDRFKEDYHIHMNDEHFEEVNEIVFPTPSKVAKVLKIDENFPTVKQVKTTKLEATGQILEYTETYKRGDYYKIKFISCDRDH